ncbi:hypothetical protein BJ170DRAFT_687211 [Xylariales sp. AK1849]|nr:hypothetical protein BJ170DRAFT_687211 [Xylariales sp. AK1849]
MYQLSRPLLAEDLINSTAYSMWLDGEDAVSGNLLFGVIDKSAFDRPLKRFRIDRERPVDGSSYPYHMTNTFNTTSRLQRESLLYRAAQTLDPEHQRAADGVHRPKFLHLHPAPRPRASSLEHSWCDLDDSDGPVLDFPVSDLGAPKLKRQYMGFDIANEEVAMATVKFQSSDSATPTEDVAFPSYGAKIPESTSNKCYADEDYAGGDSTTSSSSSNGGGDDAGLPNGEIVGIAVGFGVLALSMIGVAI